MQPCGRPFNNAEEAVVSDSPNMVAATSHSSLVSTRTMPIDAQVPDDTIPYGVRA